MVIILPNEKDGLPGLLKSLAANSEHFQKIFAYRSYSMTKVALGLPAFSIAGDSIPLNDALEKMGLSSLFTPGKADLSGISGKPNLCVSLISHKALIDVSQRALFFDCKTKGMHLLGPF